MTLSEKEIEDLLFHDLTEYAGMGIHERGFKHKMHPFDQFKWARQVNLGAYGILDLVGWGKVDGKIIINLMELKAVPLRAADFDQILRYKTAIDGMLSEKLSHSNYQINGFLVGPEIQEGHYIHNWVNNFSVVTYKYSIHGITFETHRGNWCRTDSKLSLKNYSYLWQK